MFYLRFHKLLVTELSQLYFLQTCRWLKRPKMRLFLCIIAPTELELLRKVRVFLIDRLPYARIRGGSHGTVVLHSKT